MKAAKAFTLIELLVVIAIIGTLLAVMVPALKKAKDVTKRLICASNVRSIGTALRVYGENYDEKVPPPWIDNPEPFDAVFAYRDGERRDDGSLRPLQLAILYDEGTIDSPEIFYCPAQPRNTDYPLPYYYDYYTKNGAIEWGSEAPEIPPPMGGHPYVRTSYNYWLHGEERLNKLTLEPVVIDNCQEWEVIPHKKNFDTPQGLNTLFGDGHVSFCTGSDLFAVPELWPRTEGVFNGPGDIAIYFERILKVLKGKQ